MRPLKQKKALEIEKLFQQAAEQGSALAKLNLTTLYYRKEDLSAFVPKMFKLSEEAAQAGNADAQFRVGTFYHLGYGVDTDYKKQCIGIQKLLSRVIQQG